MKNIGLAAGWLMVVAMAASAADGYALVAKPAKDVLFISLPEPELPTALKGCGANVPAVDKIERWDENAHVWREIIKDEYTVSGDDGGWRITFTPKIEPAWGYKITGVKNAFDAVFPVTAVSADGVDRNLLSAEPKSSGRIVTPNPATDLASFFAKRVVVKRQRPVDWFIRQRPVDLRYAS